MKPIPLLSGFLIFFTIVSCRQVTTYHYSNSQSKTIEHYIKNGYYEYNSPLNDSMFAYLNSLDQQLLHQSTYNTIIEVAEKIIYEKNGIGCYVIDWNPKKASIGNDNHILIEWNQNTGVVIRIFTKSDFVKSQLPKASFQYIHSIYFK